MRAANRARTSDAPATPGRGRGGRAVGALPIALTALFGILLGLGGFTFGYGEGSAYFSNDPAACINCHVMQGHYDSWLNGSHAHVAVCNDCHLPHDVVGKWVTKADNGFFHSLAFTLGGFHEPIQIKPRNRRVTQGACLHCHGDFVHAMLPATQAMLPATQDGDMLLCIHCHQDAGHAHE